MKIAYAQTVTLNGPTSLDVIGNPFSQPNVTQQIGKQSLEWYGSGDVNNDGIVNQSDLDAMNSGTSNNMSDIDGDVNPSTQSDKNILADYIANTIPYLPGHWNELTTREERKSWILKMRKLEDPRTLANGNWVCADFINQMTFDFYGLSNIEEFIQNEKNTHPNVVHSSKDNAKFNLPVYYFSTTNTSGVSHAVAGILVGEDPLKFEDWLFFNYYDVNPIKPGDFDMDANHPVKMYLESYVQDPDTKKVSFNLNGPFISFNLNNGTATLESYLKKYLTIYNPNGVTLNLGNLEKIIVDNNGLPTNQNYTPEFLESRGYKAIPDTTNAKTGTDLPIELTYTDRDTTRTSETHYKFFRDWLGKIYFGGSGATKLISSTTQEIEIDNLTPIDPSQNPIPNDFRVYQNYPNPFNPSTTIRYQISEANFVNLEVFDVLGNQVFHLVNKRQSAGTYEINFNAAKMSSGIYFYRLNSGKSVDIKKMILLK